MRSRILWIGVVAIAVSISACNTTDLAEEATAPAESELAPANGEPIPGQYIVVLKDDGVAAKTRRDMVDAYEAYPGVDMNHKYVHTITGFSGKLTPEAVNALQNDSSVDYIEEDRWVTLPPFSSQGLCDRKPNHPNCTDGGGGDDDGTSSQSTPWGITRVGGAASYTGSNVAWVLDSGIDLDHPDLNVDAGRSVSMLGGKEANNPDDQNGHGTHVAGTIAAIDNSEGVVGVAAGATVISVRVLDRRGSGSYSGVINGIDHVGANGNAGDVANMSLGGGFSQAVNDAVVSAASGGVKFFLAAGNESQDTKNVSPGSAEGANIWTICAISEGDNWASYSNYGTPVDYCEPGSGVESTWKNGGYNTISGTSMATPHAAGIALLGPINNGGSVTGPDGISYTIGIR
ncbi:MAG: S8 family serine peptidase [Bacteroidota bacterium]|nr:S8 family serine peptidase [Bacteroidota bacterium]